MQKVKEQLEALIDTNTLAYVLEAISQVCYEKEDHILTSWQDKNTATVWKSAANKLQSLSDKVGC